MLQAEKFVAIDFIIDFIFLIDIFIAFRTVFIDDQGDEEVRPNKIAARYLKSSFIIDLLSTIPFEPLIQLFATTHQSKLSTH